MTHFTVALLKEAQAGGEPVTFRFGLPMPGVSYLEFTMSNSRESSVGHGW